MESILFDSTLIRKNVTVTPFAKIVIEVCRSYSLLVHQQFSGFLYILDYEEGNSSSGAIATLSALCGLAYNFFPLKEQ